MNFVSKVAKGWCMAYESFVQTLTHPRMMFFGVVSTVVGTGVLVGMAAWWGAEMLGIDLFQRGGAMKLYEALLQLPLHQQAIPCTFTMLVLAEFLAFFYAGTYYMAIRILAKRSVSIGDALRFAKVKIKSISLLLLTFIVSVISLKPLFVTPALIGMEAYAVLIAGCAVVCMILCFAIITQVNDNASFFNALHRGIGMLFDFFFETVGMLLGWCVVAAPMCFIHPARAFLFPQPELYVYSMVAACGIATLWLIALSVMWLVFVAKVYRVSRR